jgi:hypothetical protein
MANLAYMTTEETIELWVEKMGMDSSLWPVNCVIASRHAGMLRDFEISGQSITRQQAFYVHVILCLII